MIIELGHAIENAGTGAPLRKAGPPAAPAAAVNEVQTLTGTATGGAGTLSFAGQTTPTQAFNASAATIQAALVALSTIGAGNVVCAGGPLGTAPVTVTFQGALAGADQPAIVVGAGFTGGTVVDATTTQGAPATPASFTGAPTGSLVIDTTGGLLYQNTGTAALPVWTKVGTET